jgi:magnesium-protoporphyrin IX monomethyl ester (oxidative) cyclase
VAINLIADPDWDQERFRVVRDWCMDVPEVVNISINTPYPGTETCPAGSPKLSPFKLIQKAGGTSGAFAD